MAVEPIVRCVTCASSHPIAVMPSTLPELDRMLPPTWRTGTLLGMNWAACSEGCAASVDYAMLRRYYEGRMDRFKGDDRAGETLDVHLGK